MGLKQNLQDIQTNLANAKTAIAQSITNKGVECSADEALSTYAEKIDNITGGGSGKYVVQDGMKFGYSSSIDMENLDFSNVTDMSYMFRNCTFSSIDLSNFDTANVTNISYMFYESSKIVSLDLSNFNTSKVTTIYNIFSGCKTLSEINLVNWNTSNLLKMNYVFANCSGLTTIDLSNFDTTKVQTMDWLFYHCSGLTNANCSSFITTNVSSMSNIFNKCNSLEDLQFNDLGHNESCKEIDLTNCSKLTKESVLFLFEHAFDRQSAGYSTPFNIKLHATTKALLTEDEIAIATNKGFTIV